MAKPFVRQAMDATHDEKHEILETIDIKVRIDRPLQRNSDMTSTALTTRADSLNSRMETFEIPGTSLVGSRIGLGTWAIGGWMWGGTDERSFGEQSPLFSKVFPKKNATLISPTRDTPNLIEKCSSPSALAIRAADISWSASLAILRISATDHF
jgi:hypothetical protein